ncbi:hypothetical protein RDWZM_000093 [Blomia tropicalis]|uniref:Uncharacterized protein n=1 Tax=Blomia tropicalis TaxID=40697 RepID=A0A9Q0MA65_BLOTA|nr:hypothetical protein RDWZM_000093 [Blomia tropicalis]
MSERLVNEMVTYQQSLCDSLVNENEKYKTFNEQINMDLVLSDLDRYMRKLKNLQKEMSNLTEHSKDLKKRAQHLQVLRQKEDERFADEMERFKKLEQSLKPVKPSTSKTE